MASRATVATVAIFDVPAFRPERKNLLVGEVSAAAPVGAGRAPSTPTPGFGPTWPEESASRCSLCWLNAIKIAEVHYDPLLFPY